MNLAEKITFIQDLTETVRTSILAQVTKMPANWSGMELREFIANEFDCQRVRMDKMRKTAYRKDRAAF